MEAATFVQVVNPFRDLFSIVMSSSWADLTAYMPRQFVARMHATERANLMHATVRENFRQATKWSDTTLTLVEEKSGLDYVVIDDSQHRVAVRWGKFDSTEYRVRRNNTEAQIAIQRQGYLFQHDENDEEDEALPIATIGYTVEDDYTEGLVPCGWIGRLVLVRERFGESEYLMDIANFKRPERATDTEVPERVRVSARKDALDRLQKAAVLVRGHLA